MIGLKRSLNSTFMFEEGKMGFRSIIIFEQIPLRSWIQDSDW